MSAPEAGAPPQGNQPAWASAPPVSLSPTAVDRPEAVDRFVSNFASAVNPVPGIKAIATDPQGIRHGIEHNIFQPQVDQFTKAGESARGHGEFTNMTPGERALSFAGHAAAGALPFVGPAAANAGEQIGEGDVAGGLGSGSGLLSTMAVPDLMRITGRGMSHGAEPIAENALGIRNVDRKFERNPGRAALDETTGARPETVASQAEKRVGDLVDQRNAVLRASPNQVSLAPSRQSVASDIARAGAGNSLTGTLNQVQEHLTVPHEGFAGNTEYPPGANQPVTFGQRSPYQPIQTIKTGTAPSLRISELQDPMNALAIRQRLGNDFTKFDMARPVSKEQMAVGNKAYGNLTNAIHSAVPESGPLDTRISNLIPVKESATVKDLAPQTTGQILGRLGAKTGSLAAGTMAGAHYGSPVAGAVLGAIVPELLSDPTAQMIAARGLDRAGKITRSPFTTRPVQAAQNIRPNEKP